MHNLSEKIARNKTFTFLDNRCRLFLLDFKMRQEKKINMIITL